MVDIIGVGEWAGLGFVEWSNQLVTFYGIHYPARIHEAVSVHLAQVPPVFAVRLEGQTRFMIERGLFSGGESKKLLRRLFR